MKKFYFSLIVLILFIFLFSLILPEISQAGSFMSGVENVGGKVPTLTKASPQSFAANVVKNLIIFVGVIFMIVFIYGGALYMFSQGDPKKVQKAKGLLMTAIIGLVIVMMAYTIAYFVSSSLEQSIISQ